MCGCMLRRWRVRFEVSPFDGGEIGVLEVGMWGVWACKGIGIGAGVECLLC